MRDIRAVATAVPPTPVLSDIQLVISGEVAKTLLALVNRVGGNVDSTYRKDTNTIREALLAAGVTASISVRFSNSVEANASW